MTQERSPEHSTRECESLRAFTSVGWWSELGVLGLEGQAVTSSRVERFGLGERLER